MRKDRHIKLGERGFFIDLHNGSMIWVTQGYNGKTIYMNDYRAQKTERFSNPDIKGIKFIYK